MNEGGGKKRTCRLRKSLASQRRTIAEQGGDRKADSAIFESRKSGKDECVEGSASRVRAKMNREMTLSLFYVAFVAACGARLEQQPVCLLILLFGNPCGIACQVPCAITVNFRLHSISLFQQACFLRP